MATSAAQQDPVKSNAGIALGIVTELPKFELQSYISSYTGPTKFERLYTIGVSSVPLAVEALKLAVQEAKAGHSAQRYVAAQKMLALAAPDEPDAKLDQEWLDRTHKYTESKTIQLEKELRGYKNNLVKESIRMGNEDLGKFYQSIGDYTKAHESFVRMRAEVSTNKHIVDISKHLISLAIEQKNWLLVSSQAQKLRSTQMSVEDAKALQPYMAVTSGLAYLANANYYEAALSFLSTEAGASAKSLSDIISLNDIAIYGGLCVLATMDRAELQSRVLENADFRTYLELEPHIRRALSFFINGRYSACLNILESYRADYELDIHLQAHVSELYRLVRSKSIVQYFIPFSCVTLDSLNEAFAAPGKNIESELADMIESGMLEARIDTQNRVLTSLPTLPRANLQNEVLSTAKEYTQEARRRIQRMNLLTAELEVRGGPSKNNQNILSGLSQEVTGVW